MYSIVFIFLSFLANLVSASALLIYLVGYQLVNYVFEKFTKYSQGKWIIAILAVVVIFAGLIVIQQFQEETMMVTDQTWECGIEKSSEIGFAIANYVLKEPWQWLAPKWNDAVLTARDCFKTFIDVIQMLPAITRVDFYTDILRGLFELFNCLMLVPFETPSWQIPYGASDFLSSFARFQLCISRILVQFTTRAIDYTLVRNDCEFCELDPMADCILRQPPFFAPANFPPTLTPTCEGCYSIDCEMIRCVIGTFLSNFTAPLQPVLPIQLEPFLDEFATHVCCIVTNTYKPPFWLFQGIFTGCISIFDAPDFLLNQWLQTWGNCWIDFAYFITDGEVADFFVYVFEVLFPFIEIFIESYSQLVDCGGLSAGCWNNLYNRYGNCIFSGLLVTNAGRSCAITFGQCVVNGAPGIDPNPILRFPPFNFFFLTGFPSIWIPLDAALCSVEPFYYCTYFNPGSPGRPDPVQVCFQTFGPGNLFNPLECALDCYAQEVHMLGPLFQDLRVFVNFYQGVFDGILSLIGIIIDALNDACDVVNAIPGVSGCPHIPNPFMRSEREEPTFTNWTSYLAYHDISNETSCGSILHDAMNHEISASSDPGYYLLFWSCYVVSRMAMKYSLEFPGDVQVNRALNMTTMFDELQNMLMCETKKMAAERNLTVRYETLNFESMKQDFYEHVWNSIPEIDRNDTHKYLGLYSDNKSLDDLPGTRDNAMMAMWGRFAESEYYDYASSYLAVHRAMRGRNSKWNEPDGSPLYSTRHLLPERNDSDVSDIQRRIENRLSSSGARPGSFEAELSDLRSDWSVREMYAEVVSVIINKIQSTLDHGYAMRMRKKQLLKRNAEVALKSKITGEMAPRREKIHYTASDLIKKKKEAEKFHKAADRALLSLKNVVRSIDPDGDFIPKVMKSAGLEHWEMYRGAHALYSANSAEALHNLTQYHLGNIKYAVGYGYLSHEEYANVSKKHAEEMTMFSIISGEYNPRRERSFGFAGSDPDTEWIDLGSWLRAVRPITKERKIKAMLERGIDPESEEGKAFKISFIDGITNNVVIQLFENVVAFISRISVFFGGPSFTFDLSDLVGGFIDSIDPQMIAQDSLESTLGLAKRIFSCNIPADFDGTNNYKAACAGLGFLPEGMFSNWIIAVGRGNPFIPYQIGWPAGLVATSCVNTFNGDPNLATFRFSDNCGNLDMLPRPLCSSPVSCDWCQKDFNTCADIGLNSPFDTLFFMIGYIPVLLQNFFTGVIGASTLTMAFMFVFMYLIGVGGIQIIASFPLALAITLLQYLIINIFDEVFHGLSEPGSEGGIPFGLIFVLLYLLVVTFGGSLINSLPSFLGVSVGGGLSFLWFINLISPFRSIRSDLKLTVWVAQFLRVIRDAPTPLAFIPGLDHVISIAQKYDYSTTAVPSEDIFCFFWTSSNLMLLVAGAVILSDVFQLFAVFFWPLIYFVFDIIAAVLTLYQSVRLWANRERISDNSDRIDNLERFVKFMKDKAYRSMNKKPLLG